MPPISVDGVTGSSVWTEHPTPEQIEREIAEMEGYGLGPFYIPPVVAESAIARWGRLPRNLVVQRSIPPVPTFPSIAIVGTPGPARGAQWKREQKYKRKP